MKILRWLFVKSLISLLLWLGLLAWFLLSANAEMAKPLQAVTDTAIVIAPGQSWWDSVNRLEQKHIASRWWVIGYTLWHPRAWRLRAGEYRLSPGMSAAELLDDMMHGHVWLHPVTLIEGMTIKSVRQYLNGLTFLDNDLSTVSDSELIAKLNVAPGLAAVNLEGLLAADTFKVPLHTRQSSLLNEALRLNDKRLSSIWAERADAIAVKTPYEALILASLIERETANAEERPIISAVFHNRLMTDMRLQTDPTIIYALGARYDGHLHHADLQVDSPYNTYRYAGLPPSPIGLVGKASLQAAVHPARSAFLYFVATGEHDGRHRFATTLKQHEANVKLYIDAKSGAP
jgi:UPF0755 protein